MRAFGRARPPGAPNGWIASGNCGLLPHAKEAIVSAKNPEVLHLGRSLLSVIIVYHQARMNDAWNPPEQSQKDTEQKTGDTTGHKHRKGRQHHAEKISKRLQLVT